ncbi:MAG TPA: hypothetical protein VFP86_13750 [bacterium]|nr:hypothetical protein [bacterium]
MAMGPIESRDGIEAPSDSWTRWREDIRVAATIFGVLLLVSVAAAVCVRLLLGI